MNAFLIPQWGGVVLQNIPNSPSQFHFDSKRLEPIMQMFMTQIRILLGIRSIQTPRLSTRNINSIVFEKSSESGITMLELDRLFRERTVQNIKDASSTLVSLATLINKLPNMIVNDHINTRVIESLDFMEKAREYLGKNDLVEAARNGRQATVAAEAAFFDKSMVSLLYFPSEHLLAM